MRISDWSSDVCSSDLGTGDRNEKAATGSLYVFGPDHSWQVVDRDIICPNGPAFSLDGRFAYFSDSYVQQIVRYPIDPATGKIGPRQPFARVTDAGVFPDGLTVAAAGRSEGRRGGKEGVRTGRYRGSPYN